MHVLTCLKGQIKLPLLSKTSRQYSAVFPEINRDWLPLSVADERLQTSWGCKKQTKSTMRNETGVLSTTIPSLLVLEAKE